MQTNIPDLKQHQLTLSSGKALHYNIGGDENGAPVVLLHGGGTDNAMLSWSDTIPALIGAGFRVYAPNYPGYGPSPLDDKPSTMDNLIDYLEMLMDAWALEQASLVGISMGGALTLGYTLSHPDRVRNLTLIGSYGIQDYAPFHFWSHLFVQMPWLVDLTWKMMRGSRWAAVYSLNSIINNPDSRTDALVDEVLEAMNNPSAQEAFSQWQRDEVLRDRLKTNYTDRLHEIDAPVLLVHGSKDAGVPLKYAERAATKFKDVQFEIIENAGHWTQRDYPDVFNRLLIDFLNTHAK